MNILVVDDERPARAELLHAISELSPESDCLEAHNGKEALRLLEDESIDLCFLDIQMPGLDGLALASQIMKSPTPPLIVFATAYDAHAIRAFELAALDYLVKPFSSKRLAQVLDRARGRLGEKAELVKNISALRDYLLPEGGENRLRKLTVEGKNDVTVLLAYEEISWIEAKDRKVFAHTLQGEAYLVRSTLQDIHAKLEAFGFARVHKSFLVNLEHVTEIAPMFSGTSILKLADLNNTQVPVSRKYSKGLKSKFAGL